MSNVLAITAVTKTLARMLARGIEDVTVSSKPLDRAAADTEGRRINLFLYQVSTNAAWRNMELPPPGKGTLPQATPLALDLHYLLTPFATDQEELLEHQLLAQAMRVLHDNAILSPEFIHDSTLGTEADLHQQIERVRLTYQTMPLEEMSKLWTAFQTPLRMSAAYTASVVLIESAHPRRNSQPVLSVGEQNLGPDIAATLPPQLHGVIYADVDARQPKLPAARISEADEPAEIVTLQGTGLERVRNLVVYDPARRGPDAANGTGVVARLSPLSANSSTIRVQLDPQLGWIAGPLAIAAEYFTPAGKSRLSNPMQFAVAPGPIISAGGVSIIDVPEGERRLLVVNLQYPVRDDAKVFLVLTSLDSDVAPPWLPAIVTNLSDSTTSPAFDITNVVPGRYRLQISADNIESQSMARAGGGYRFDERLEVEL